MALQETGAEKAAREKRDGAVRDAEPPQVLRRRPDQHGRNGQVDEHWADAPVVSHQSKYQDVVRARRGEAQRASDSATVIEPYGPIRTRSPRLHRFSYPQCSRPSGNQNLRLAVRWTTRRAPVAGSAPAPAPGPEPGLR